MHEMWIIEIFILTKNITRIYEYNFNERFF